MTSKSRRYTMTSPHSNTVGKQSKHKRNITGLKPFVKGDPRINRKGRPRDFDALRKLVQEFLAEDGKKKNRMRLVDLLENMAITRGERRALLEFAFGKVPDRIEGAGEHGGQIVHLYMPGNNREDASHDD